MKKTKKRLTYYVVYILICLLVLLMILPMIFMLCSSFMGADEVNLYYQGMYNDGMSNNFTSFHLIPDRFTLSQYYNTMFSSPIFWKNFWNTIYISFPILIGVLVTATLCGYGLAKFHFKGKRLMLYFYLIVMMLPYQVTLVPNFMVIDFFKLIGNRSAVILPNIFTTFGCYLMYQYIQKIPNDFLEYARIDGLSEIKVFFYIVIPQLKTGITSLILLNLIDTFGLIEQPLVFLQDVEKQPLSVSMAYINQSDITIAFVSGVIFVFPLILTFLLGKDSLVQGISDTVI